ncbi:hypothetical protein BDZ97DRAFT_1166335 [Flammula alnicola]|nr:hypothetical protein BDZ97DRAFT_1166335 [Flammula alnicola]
MRRLRLKSYPAAFTQNPLYPAFHGLELRLRCHLVSQCGPQRLLTIFVRSHRLEFGSTVNPYHNLRILGHRPTVPLH